MTGHVRAGLTPSSFLPSLFFLTVPFFIVFLITTCETWADTLASMEASRLDVTGKALQIMRQKGALLNDTLSGIFAALSGVLPLTTFAQNNGIISLTNVASRRVGISCGIWLLILGILSKIGAFIQSIPSCVLGGMTTFLFANVLASGMHILLQDPGALKRRNRFIIAATMGCGVGVTLWPAWAREALWPIDAHMVDGSALGRAKKGVRDAIILILSTGFVFGAFPLPSVALPLTPLLLLSLLLPPFSWQGSLWCVHSALTGMCARWLTPAERILSSGYDNELPAALRRRGAGPHRARGRPHSVRGNADEGAAARG